MRQLPAGRLSQSRPSSLSLYAQGLVWCGRAAGGPEGAADAWLGARSYGHTLQSLQKQGEGHRGH